MDDSGSFSETCNLYSNAVSKLQDSDDDDLSCTQIVDNYISEEFFEPPEKSLSNSRQQRKGREQPPLCTESRKRTRFRPCSSWQCIDSIEPPHSEMINIIELNDDSPPIHRETNREDSPQIVKEINWEDSPQIVKETNWEDSPQIVKETDWEDSPQIVKESNWEEFNAGDGEIIWESAKTTIDILKEESDEADFSTSCIDIEDEVAIHVKWRMKASKPFHLKKTDTMKQIFQYFAQEEGIPEKQVQLTHNGKQISIYDTPEKFQGSVVVMLEGRLKTVNNSSEQPQEDRDPNQIELKLLTKDRKDKLSMFILRSDTLEVFMEKAAKQLDLPRSKLLFKFDGETLDSSDTPQSLDLEGGECIEAIVRS